jgi:hypothetical protein
MSKLENPPSECSLLPPDRCINAHFFRHQHVEFLCRPLQLKLEARTGRHSVGGCRESGQDRIWVLGNPCWPGCQRGAFERFLDRRALGESGNPVSLLSRGGSNLAVLSDGLLEQIMRMEGCMQLDVCNWHRHNRTRYRYIYGFTPHSNKLRLG